MVDLTISELVFKQLTSIPENANCFDCGTLPNFIYFFIGQGNP